MQPHIQQIVLDHTASLFTDVAALRRTIHANPELSGHEYKTAQLVFDTLTKTGLSPRFFLDKTCVVTSIENGNGPTIALRADMDALPIEEHNDVPYKSKNPGVMHACGHDMHTANLLGTARLLLLLRDYWHGTVVLLFQPSEEANPGGAMPMIKAGAFPENAIAVFGMHCSTDHPTGSIGLRAGVDHAGVLDFDMTITGKGGHGAAPHDTVDPIVCASQIVTALQSIVSRECPPSEPAVVTIGSFHAGTKRNIIPDTAHLSGTIRTLSDKRQDHFETRVTQIATGIATSCNATASITFERSYPPLFNDPGTTEKVSTVLKNFFGQEYIIHRQIITMGAEDFAYFAMKVPGQFLHLGVRKPDQSTMPGLHNACFLPDETALKTGMAAFAAIVCDYLGGSE